MRAVLGRDEQREAGAGRALAGSPRRAASGSRRCGSPRSGFACGCGHAGLDPARWAGRCGARAARRHERDDLRRRRRRRRRSWPRVPRATRPRGSPSGSETIRCVSSDTAIEQRHRRVQPAERRHVGGDEERSRAAFARVAESPDALAVGGGDRAPGSDARRPAVGRPPRPARPRRPPPSRRIVLEPERQREMEQHLRVRLALDRRRTATGRRRAARSRLTAWKSLMRPLCMNSQRPWRNGWQFVRWTAVPLDARMWARNSGDVTCAASSRRFASFHAGSISRNSGGDLAARRTSRRRSRRRSSSRRRAANAGSGRSASAQARRAPPGGAIGRAGVGEPATHAGSFQASPATYGRPCVGAHRPDRMMPRAVVTDAIGVTAGGAQRRSSTSRCGQHSCSSRLNAPGGAGSQFGTPGPGSACWIRIVTAPSGSRHEAVPIADRVPLHRVVHERLAARRRS